jgi:hypothetical protein
VIRNLPLRGDLKGMWQFITLVLCRLMAWVGDNKRDMVEVAQMMETIMFGLLEPDFYLRRVLPNIEEII